MYTTYIIFRKRTSAWMLQNHSLFRLKCIANIWNANKRHTCSVYQLFYCINGDLSKFDILSCIPHAHVYKLLRIFFLSSSLNTDLSTYEKFSFNFSVFFFSFEQLSIYYYGSTNEKWVVSLCILSKWKKNVPFKPPEKIKCKM